MKRSVRQQERAARRADPSTAAAATAAWYAARRTYRELRRLKRESFWSGKIDSERLSPANLWRSVDTLMGRGRMPLAEAIGPNDLHNYFDEKVAAVQTATMDAPPPSFTPAPPGLEFSQFRLVTTSDVIAAVRA